MNFLKRLLAWFIGISLVPVFLIGIWLITFGSFELLPALRNDVTIIFTGLVGLVWGMTIICMSEREINDFVA